MLTKVKQEVNLWHFTVLGLDLVGMLHGACFTERDVGCQGSSILFNVLIGCSCYGQVLYALFTTNTLAGL